MIADKDSIILITDKDGSSYEARFLFSYKDNNDKYLFYKLDSEEDIYVARYIIKNNEYIFDTDFTDDELSFLDKVYASLEGEK